MTNHELYYTNIHISCIVFPYTLRAGFRGGTGSLEFRMSKKNKLINKRQALNNIGTSPGYGLR